MSLKGEYELDTEEIKVLRKQIADLEAKLTGYDTPEERELDKQITNLERKLNELIWQRKNQLIQEYREKKTGMTEEEYKKMQEELKKKHIEEALHPKITEDVASSKLIETWVTKQKLPEEPERRGTLDFKAKLTFEGSTTSIEPMRLVYNEDEDKWVPQSIEGNCDWLRGYVEVDENGLPVKIFRAGYGSIRPTYFFDVNLIKDKIPENIKKYFIKKLRTQRIKELQTIVDLTIKDNEKLHSLLLETEGELNQARQELNQARQQIKQFEEGKGIINKLKQIVR